MSVVVSSASALPSARPIGVSAVPDRRSRKSRLRYLPWIPFLPSVVVEMGYIKHGDGKPLICTASREASSESETTWG